MRLLSKAVWVLAASALLFTAGCKKKEEGSVASVEQALAEGKWDVSAVNGLLPYIPEDSSYVYASIRYENMDVRFKNRFATIDLEGLKKVKIPADAGGELVENLLKSWADLGAPLMNDYDNASKEWGLSEKCRMDTVAYMLGDMMVNKWSVEDGQKFEAKALAMLDLLRKALGDETALALTERKVGNDVFKIVSIKPYLDGSKGECVLCDDNKKTLLPTNIVWHFGKNIVTCAIMFDNMDDASLSKLLAVAEKPFKKETLAALAGTKDEVQYLDVSKMYKMVTTGGYKPILNELLDGEMNPACEKELGEIVAQYPSVVCTQEAAEKSISGECVLRMADTEMLKKLQALHVNATQLDTSKAGLALGLNLDLTAAVSLVGEIQTQISSKGYACEALKELPNELGEITRMFSDPQVKMFTNGLGAIHMVLNNMSMVNGNLSLADVDAAVALSGSSVGTIMPIVSGLAAPELGNMLGLQKDVVKEIDLTSMVKQPLKLKAIYKDTALVVGTPNQDVQAIASKPQTKSGMFLDMVYSDKLSKMLSDVTGQPSEMGIKGAVYIGVGTNSEGLVMKTTIQR